MPSEKPGRESRASYGALAVLYSYCRGSDAAAGARERRGESQRGESETRTPEASGRGAQSQLRAPAPRAPARPGPGPAPRGKSAPGVAPSAGCRAGTGRGRCAHPCPLGKGRSREPGTSRKFQRRGWLAAARRREAPWIPRAGRGRRPRVGIGGEVHRLVRQPPPPCMVFRGSQARGERGRGSGAALRVGGAGVGR